MLLPLKLWQSIHRRAVVAQQAILRLFQSLERDRPRPHCFSQSRQLEGKCRLYGSLIGHLPGLRGLLAELCG